MACSIAGALEAVGDRWAFLILRDLSLGLCRYDDLKRSTQIPNSTLVQRLTHLEQTGLIQARPYQQNPVRYEYTLTLKGREFGIVLMALAQWGDRWDAAETGAPPVNFVDSETGHKLKVAVVNASTDKPVPGTRVEAKPGRGADELVKWRLTHQYPCDT